MGVWQSAPRVRHLTPGDVAEEKKQSEQQKPGTERGRQVTDGDGRRNAAEETQSRIGVSTEKRSRTVRAERCSKHSSQQSAETVMGEQSSRQTGNERKREMVRSSSS